MIKKNVPVISIVGWANTGKTTFLEKLLVEMKSRGLRVGVIKHHRGSFEIDQPGKDTWRFARAGAACTAIAGPEKIGLVMEMDHDPSPQEVVALMPEMDIFITEGYKKGPYPQIEVRREGYGESKPASQPGQLVAVVGDQISCTENVPCFSSQKAAAVADFIINKYSLKK